MQRYRQQGTPGSGARSGRKHSTDAATDAAIVAEAKCATCNHAMSENLGSGKCTEAGCTCLKGKW